MSPRTAIQDFKLTTLLGVLNCVLGSMGERIVAMIPTDLEDHSSTSMILSTISAHFTLLFLFEKTRWHHSKMHPTYRTDDG
ncbi:hypothetical protein JOM56_000365 [Amanita muscaria]